jgi:hypothetical protein
MSTPLSPRLLKGAVIGIDPMNPAASVIIFQYNPDSLSRVLTARTVGGTHGERSEPMRLLGAPTEVITATVEIDATDQLEQADPVATSTGIHPQLAALEMLIYPKSASVIANTLLLAAGTMEVVPPEAPLTILIWGVKRILPVRLSGFTINEQAHDVNLNPIRASVTLNFNVLSYSDLPTNHPGYALFLAHQVTKEAMATQAGLRNIGAIAGGKEAQQAVGFV